MLGYVCELLWPKSLSRNVKNATLAGHLAICRRIEVTGGEKVRADIIVFKFM